MSRSGLTTEQPEVGGMRAPSQGGKRASRALQGLTIEQPEAVGMRAPSQGGKRTPSQGGSPKSEQLNNRATSRGGATTTSRSGKRSNVPPSRSSGMGTHRSISTAGTMNSWTEEAKTRLRADPEDSRDRMLTNVPQVRNAGLVPPTLLEETNLPWEEAEAIIDALDFSMKTHQADKFRRKVERDIEETTKRDSTLVKGDNVYSRRSAKLHSMRTSNTFLSISSSVPLVSSLPMTSSLPMAAG